MTINPHENRHGSGADPCGGPRRLGTAALLVPRLGAAVESCSRDVESSPDVTMMIIGIHRSYMDEVDFF